METIQNDVWNMYSRLHEDERYWKILSERVEEKGIRRSVFQDKAVADNSYFNFHIVFDETMVSDQGKTGRCWIYASIGMLEPVISKKNGLNGFPLSENYIGFFDLFEKSNYFLQFIIENIDVDPEDRILAMKLFQPIQDAGQWFFFRSIIQKYGIVTRCAMRDTKASRDSRELIEVLSDILREYAAILFHLHKEGQLNREGLLKEKQRMLCDIYYFLTVCLGAPPEKFDCILERENGTLVKETNITPWYFYEKYIGKECLDDYCVLVNFPQNSKSFFENYQIEWINNVWESYGGVYTNLPMANIKQYVKKQLDAGIPVWVGCDSMPYSDGESGIYSLENYDLTKIGFRYAYTDKETNLMYGLSRPRHAIVVLDYVFEKGKDSGVWLFRNSYGTEIGKGGYLLVSDAWFDLYVYEVVVEKKFLSEEAIKWFGKQPHLLKPWDVLGTLA